MCPLQVLASHDRVAVSVPGQVYGVDVGHGQVMGSIAQDPRVTVMERINLRHLQPSQLPEQVGLSCGVGAAACIMQ
jgi:predicted rRNA methylase YqxC with S4 and FtsJ domains